VTSSTPAPQAPPARTAPLLTALVAAFFFALPFHRPVLTRALGPALGLPELLFPLLALALVLAARSRLRLAPWPGVLLAAVLAVGFSPAIFASDRPVASAAQLAVFAYIAFIYQAGVLVKTLGLRRPALLAFAAGAVSASLVGLAGAILNHLGFGPFGLSIDDPWLSPPPRPIGPTESPTMLALIAFAGAVALVTLHRQGELSRRATGAGLLILGLTILATQSRVVLASLGALGAVAAMQGKPNRQRVWGRVSVVAIAGFLALTLLWRILPLQPHWPFVDTRISNYHVRHQIAGRMFLDHPAAGVGLERFRAFWPHYYLPERYDRAYDGGREFQRGFPFDPHNTLLGFLAEGGIPGGLTVIAVAVLVWRRRAPGPETVALVVATVLNTLHTDMLTERSTWALLGLLAMAAPAVASRRNGWTL